MKLFEVFFLSLFLSLLAGAFLFLGIPLTGYWVVSDKQGNFFDSEMAIILVVLYAIYAIIQLILSIVNLIQIVHLRSTVGSYLEGSNLVRRFLIAEFILYFIVFTVIISLIGIPVIFPAVLIFSVPYVICCTASIYIFRYFLKKEFVSDSIYS